MEQKIRSEGKLHHNQFIAKESGVYVPAPNNKPLEKAKALAPGHSPSSWLLHYLFIILTYISACAGEACIQMS